LFVVSGVLVQTWVFLLQERRFLWVSPVFRTQIGLCIMQHG